MYLFIDTLSDPTYIALFDEHRKIIDARTWPGKQKEFDTLTEEIDSLLHKHTLSYRGLAGIVVIVGPGGFTGTRVTTLIANALNYGFNTPLFPITVGEFFAFQDAPLPWISSVTKKEVLVWNEKKPNNYVLEKIENLPANRYSGLTQIDFGGAQSTIRLAQDYSSVIHGLNLRDSMNRIQPLYAKAPNITIPTLHGGNAKHQ